ncbi:MAG: hypothetical protein COW16_07780 [Sphingomonadales bacterium CG12_big_fil_rev_8_21_14_0_65_65_10]|nr:MAG: hypothetical protein COW16_07780 [Sphingomonadales bacterium CG12_big_fil_rev_8_21_14_0_65_65_10]
MTAMVFGGNGGIGAALVEALAARGEAVHAFSRTPMPGLETVVPHVGDPFDEDWLAGELARVGEATLVIVACGVLTLPGGTGPEKSYRALDAAAMGEVLRINTVLPALIAKHALPLLPRKARGVFAAISAKVGSIADNGLGGWHSYRASKAALNMLVRNFAIELARTHKQAAVVALHPGTVDTALSEPFQQGLPEGQVRPPQEAARDLLAVIDAVTPQDSGSLIAFDGERLPY